MQAREIIAKKRDGQALSDAEIRWFISRYTAGDVPDYQAAALLMAIYLQGMTTVETVALTMAMIETGERLSFKDVIPHTVDKHSTGGVGDKTTLALCPIVAAAGLPVAKMSGRGLGFTGGTLDKLESIPGFRVALSTDEFRAQVRDVGLVIAGQTAQLAPADGRLYALRDVTATIASLPLIASSIMSKKLAGGADAILLDVKVGHGAFMPALDQAEALARLIIHIGKSQGREVTALLTAMDQPLGMTVGNALETGEAIEILRGGGPVDTVELVLTLAGHMLALGKVAPGPEEGRRIAEKTVADGSGLRKLRQCVVAQGGDPAVIDDPRRLPVARHEYTIPAPGSGYLAALHARRVGIVAMNLGAGRQRLDDPIDHAVGVRLHAPVGQMVARGEPLFTVYANHEERIAPAAEELLAACSWSADPVPAPALIHGVIQ